jgi:hypothetical protein
VYAAEFKKGTDANHVINPTQPERKLASDTRWDADVKKIKDMFQGPCVDHFVLSEACTKLINTNTGAVAPDTIEESLCSALVFVSSLAAETPKSFCVPLSKSNVKTMKEMH